MTLDMDSFDFGTSPGVILRHLLELAPAAWHTAYARHQSSSACLNSQNDHPPHGTPSFMAFPTYKLGCDRRCSPVVSVVNSASCQPTLSSTSPWHTADRIDFLFSGHLLMLLVSSAQLPALSQISWFSAQKTAPCPEAAAQATTAAAAVAAAAADQVAKPCQNLSGLGFDWLQF